MATPTVSSPLLPSKLLYVQGWGAGPAHTMYGPGTSERSTILNNLAVFVIAIGAVVMLGIFRRHR